MTSQVHFLVKPTYRLSPLPAPHPSASYEFLCSFLSFSSLQVKEEKVEPTLVLLEPRASQESPGTQVGITILGVGPASDPPPISPLSLPLQTHNRKIHRSC